MIDVNVWKCIYEGVIVPSALYVAEVWGMRSSSDKVFEKFGLSVTNV